MVRIVQEVNEQPVPREKKMKLMMSYEVCYLSQENGGPYGGVYVRRLADIFQVIGFNDFYHKDCNLTVRELHPGEKITVEYSGGEDAVK